MSIARVLLDAGINLAATDVYELSSRGPFFRFLKRNSRSFTCSEFYDDVAPGQVRDGVQCQNVEALTFADASFDLCTSTEVFEHVPHDMQGFREMHRVLRPGGMMLFTVPLEQAAQTVERARLLAAGNVEHLLPPVYHGDRIRGGDKVLCFRDYGMDIVERLCVAGFANAKIISPANMGCWEQERPVVVAIK